eukprot:GHVU01121259.1.p1 GENE.GHVU01121259.1~~GHVU01121259.1.p1  ORF type:complete len:334 (+),score=76.28 GHVU01121259.1:2957-3958(+)
MTPPCLFVSLRRLAASAASFVFDGTAGFDKEANETLVRTGASITNLSIDSCHLNRRMIETLQLAPQQVTGLKHLDLSNNQIDDEGAMSLLNNLRQHCTGLEELLLRNTGIKAPAVSALADCAVTWSSTLRALDVSHNSIEVAGVEELDNVLAAAKGLRSLKMRAIGVLASDVLKAIGSWRSPLDGLNWLDVTTGNPEDLAVFASHFADNSAYPIIYDSESTGEKRVLQGYVDRSKTREEKEGISPTTGGRTRTNDTTRQQSSEEMEEEEEEEEEEESPTSPNGAMDDDGDEDMDEGGDEAQEGERGSHWNATEKRKSAGNINVRRLSVVKPSE